MQKSKIQCRIFTQTLQVLFFPSLWHKAVGTKEYLKSYSLLLSRTGLCLLLSCTPVFSFVFTLFILLSCLSRCWPSIRQRKAHRTSLVPEQHQVIWCIHGKLLRHPLFWGCVATCNAWCVACQIMFPRGVICEVITHFVSERE